MALDWLTRVNNQPALLGISVNKGHASNAAMRQTGEFNIVLRDVAITYGAQTTQW
jgi:flavin reductase (DIM6/NTAB) family NADH-FMN oxidoreductase RutF